eukprot:6063111-Pleurochrysis_carterae.AAC.2
MFFSLVLQPRPLARNSVAALLSGGQWSYTLRFNFTAVPSSRTRFDRFASGDSLSRTHDTTVCPFEFVCCSLISRRGCNESVLVLGFIAQLRTTRCLALLRHLEEVLRLLHQWLPLAPGTRSQRPTRATHLADACGREYYALHAVAAADNVHTAGKPTRHACVACARLPCASPPPLPTSPPVEHCSTRIRARMHAAAHRHQDGSHTDDAMDTPSHAMDTPSHAMDTRSQIPLRAQVAARRS